MKRTSFLLVAFFAALALQAKTLIVYYSFTNNVHTIVSDLRTQIEADVVRVQPAEKGIDYAAHNYAAGSALIAAIRNAPDDAASYPAIDDVQLNFDEYERVVVAAPLWWSSMAAPLQTFLFQHGAEMAGKDIALIVSSASSGISGVEADAKRLIPGGNFLTPSLWIRSSQTSDCHRMIAEWLSKVGLDTPAGLHEAAATGAEVSAHGDLITIKGDFDRMDLFDLGGRRMLSSQTASVRTGQLPRGVYLIRLQSGAATQTAKLTAGK